MISFSWENLIMPWCYHNDFSHNYRKQSQSYQEYHLGYYRIVYRITVVLCSVSTYQLIAISNWHICIYMYVYETAYLNKQGAPQTVCSTVSPISAYWRPFQSCSPWKGRIFPSRALSQLLEIDSHILPSLRV